MSDKNGATGAIIVAAGKGSRMGLGYNKVLAKLCGKPVIEWTLQSFIRSGLVDVVVLVISPEDKEAMESVCKPYINDTRLMIVNGGTDRQDSVYNGVRAMPESVDVILVHDGARPFVDSGIIERSITSAREHGAACAGIPVTDTIKVVDENRTIITSPDRNTLWSAQTPQAFQKEILKDSHKRASDTGIRGTDDAALAEAAGFRVVMFEGSYRNIKITTQEDLMLAEKFFQC